MAFSWEFDAATGVYKNHALSSKIRTQAIVDCEVAQFARSEPGFGRKSGENVTITKFKSLSVPTTAVLDEQTRIPIDTFEMATSSITVAEWGRAVEHTNLAQLLSKFDLENPIQKALKNQLSVYTDNAAATALATSYVCAIPTAASTVTWDTDGTPSTAATVNLNAALCGLIRDYMRDTLVIPWYEKGRYMSVASTKALRGIKSDGEFQAWRQYLQPQDVIYNSEVGDLEQIRFVESNNTSALSNAKGTGSVLGEAFIFGDDALALVEALTPEIRLAIPGDFGRVQAAAWYGVLAFGLPWSATATAGEVKVVRVTSS